MTEDDPGTTGRNRRNKKKEGKEERGFDPRHSLCQRHTVDDEKPRLKSKRSKETSWSRGRSGDGRPLAGLCAPCGCHGSATTGRREQKGQKGRTL